MNRTANCASFVTVHTVPVSDFTASGYVADMAGCTFASDAMTSHENSVAFVHTVLRATALFIPVMLIVLKLPL